MHSKWLYLYLYLYGYVWRHLKCCDDIYQNIIIILIWLFEIAYTAQRAHMTIIYMKTFVWPKRCACVSLRCASRDKIITIIIKQFMCVCTWDADRKNGVRGVRLHSTLAGFFLSLPLLELHTTLFTSLLTIRHITLSLICHLLPPNIYMNCFFYCVSVVYLYLRWANSSRMWLFSLSLSLLSLTLYLCLVLSTFVSLIHTFILYGNVLIQVHTHNHICFYTHIYD